MKVFVFEVHVLVLPIFNYLSGKLDRILALGNQEPVKRTHIISFLKIFLKEVKKWGIFPLKTSVALDFKFHWIYIIESIFQIGLTSQI